MSVDRTLHMTLGVASKRNVLKRDERIAIMLEDGRFDPNTSPLGLPKTRIKHSKAGMKTKKEEAPAAATAEVPPPPRPRAMPLRFPR